MARRPTSTSAFGVSKRESHDSSDFYRRFTPPVISTENEVARFRALDKLIVGDSRSMDEVPNSSVALVVTSPPYFAGKEYEQSLGSGGVPTNYLEYLELLRDVFAECARKLEPGGRIAVNVANLGRRPYRSLSADVVHILQDDLRLLLRGEVIWVKQRGASGSCAWGSFQSPANPVLRDLTERVIVASKGRFDRALPASVRAKKGLPSEPSMTKEDFMEATLDLWEIPAESATRVGHPAPFPVELPARLINLYTYRGDLVLDPFVGSGTTAVAAVRAGRHFAGYDLDESYIELAETRVREERQRLEGPPSGAPHTSGGAPHSGGASPSSGAPSSDGASPSRGALSSGVTVQRPARSDGRLSQFLERAVREGRAANEIARSLLEASGFCDIVEGLRQPGGITVNFAARGLDGRLWLFDVAGSFTSYKSGLERSDVLWKVLGKAAVLAGAGSAPFVVLTPSKPVPGSSIALALEKVTGPGKPVHSVIEMLRGKSLEQLRALCHGPHPAAPSCLSL